MTTEQANQLTAIYNKIVNYPAINFICVASGSSSGSNGSQVTRTTYVGNTKSTIYILIDNPGIISSLTVAGNPSGSVKQLTSAAGTSHSWYTYTGVALNVAITVTSVYGGAASVFE